MLSSKFKDPGPPRDGDFVRRFASFDQLNAPWGMMVAPSNFGVVANHVVIGNFGDGHINVFTRGGAPVEQLMTQKGRAITTLVIDASGNYSMAGELPV